MHKDIPGKLGRVTAAAFLCLAVTEWQRTLHEDAVGPAPLVEFGRLLVALSVAETDWDPWGLQLAD